ncbi:MAG: beta-ketoacyl-[acyl-carrier-protein] synthase family protein [Rhodopirellula sp.]|nr:beta-ketoacyl-[acyl-carrier-protein] synthase family protein [Rhodopirellula sp.]
MPPVEVVITGVGVVSPIGIGREPFWDSLLSGRSGVGRLQAVDPSDLPVKVSAEVKGFSPKTFIANRKAMKVMSRDAQLGIAASVLACQEAGIAAGSVDPDRFGVVLGADRICGSVEESEEPYRRCITDGRFDLSRWGTEGMAASFPLSFLRVLPNMIASHVSIAHDARGPNNTIHHGEVSSLLAVAEAARAIQRGAADVMMAGGASSQIEPFDWVRYSSLGRASRNSDPTAVPRPFDCDRDGEVIGEGAAVLVLESLAHAQARGAKVLARILGFSSASEAWRCNGGATGAGLRRVLVGAVERAGLKPSQLGYVNAHGVGTVDEDRIEAAAIRDVLGSVLVTAPKSYFGNLGAAAGAVEIAAGILSLEAGLALPTLNCENLDPHCPVHLVREEPMTCLNRAVLLVNRTPIGQAAALVIGTMG